MKASVWILAIGAVALGLGSGAWIAYRDGMLANAREPMGFPRELPEVAVAPTTSPQGRIAATIAMTPYGYQPQSVSIERGEVVAFVNAATATQWPAGERAGDARAPGIVEPGRAWYAAMDEEGSYEVRDRVYPNAAAIIEVR